MTQHLICVTVDTDPDNLSGQQINRGDLSWRGLDFALAEFRAVLEMPLTWYVRADGQLMVAYGTPLYLFEQHAAFWQDAQTRGDELGWHPHLYAAAPNDDAPQLIRDETAALAALTDIAAHLQTRDVALPTFRMGEAWHTPRTYRQVESLGFVADSSAIPGRDDSASGHPRNWSGAPNHPYFPAQHDVRVSSTARPLLEVPMTSWAFAAPYDNAPRLRYMNPCIHADLWQQALDHWASALPAAPLHVWTLILHPIEAMPHTTPDALYAHSLPVVRDNLNAFTRRIAQMGHEWRYTTVAQAATQWREHGGQRA